MIPGPSGLDPGPAKLLGPARRVIRQPARQISKSKVNSNKKGAKNLKPSKVPGQGTEAGAALVADKIDDVHALLDDSADHIGQDSIDLVSGVLDQNVSSYGDGSISEVEMLAVAEDGLVTTRQAIAEAKAEAKKARELVAEEVKPMIKRRNPRAARTAWARVTASLVWRAMTPMRTSLCQNQLQV